MSLKRPLVVVPLAVASYLVAFLLTMRFGQEIRGFIGPRGESAVTGVPVHYWTVHLWPIACFACGFATGSVC